LSAYDWKLFVDVEDEKIGPMTNATKPNVVNQRSKIALELPSLSRGLIEDYLLEGDNPHTAKPAHELLMWRYHRKLGQSP
jgi:hypothetical protein